MAVTFQLKVVNPVLPPGTVLANVNWSGPPYESMPDMMPTATVPVAFVRMPANGAFHLWASDGSRVLPGRAVSPQFTAEDGATYVWDMAANRVTKEAGAPPTLPPAPAPGPAPGDGGELGTLLDRALRWAAANPVPAAGIALVGYLTLFGGGRRGRWL